MYKSTLFDDNMIKQTDIPDRLQASICPLSPNTEKSYKRKSGPLLDSLLTTSKCCLCRTAVKVKNRKCSRRRRIGSKTLWLPAVPRAGARQVPLMPSSHWGRKTRSAAALEAAVIWSELTEESPGCSSGIARQPNGTQTHTESKQHYQWFERH